MKRLLLARVALLKAWEKAAGFLKELIAFPKAISVKDHVGNQKASEGPEACTSN